MDKTRQRIAYIAGDVLSSIAAWTLFNVVRYYVGERAIYEFSTLRSFMTSQMVLIGEVVFPLMMLAVHAVSGFYNEVLRKSHVQNLITTFFTSLANTLIIFFIALINDVVLEQRGTNYEILFILLTILFVATFLSRFFITKRINDKLASGEWKYNAVY